MLWVEMSDKKKQMKTDEKVRWNEEVSYLDVLRWDICCRNGNQLFKKKIHWSSVPLTIDKERRQIALWR